MDRVMSVEKVISSPLCSNGEVAAGTADGGAGPSTTLRAVPLPVLRTGRK